jgi:hypothetical protein
MPVCLPFSTRSWRLAALAMVVALSPAAAQAAKIAVFPINVIDTSNEPGDATADHERRAQAMALAVAEELGKQRDATTTTLTHAELNAKCPTNDADCQIGIATATGATMIVVTTVHKVSSLILNISVRLVDTRTNRTTWGRDMSFRADNDQAWQRAGRYLAGEIREGLTAPAA